MRAMDKVVFGIVAQSVVKKKYDKIMGKVSINKFSDENKPTIGYIKNILDCYNDYVNISKAYEQELLNNIKLCLDVDDICYYEFVPKDSFLNGLCIGMEKDIQVLKYKNIFGFKLDDVLDLINKNDVVTYKDLKETEICLIQIL